jgi:eukaryotic-like serine/threonine-protein kinase
MLVECSLSGEIPVFPSPKVRTCPQCNRTYPDDADFCLKDGTPLPPPAAGAEAVLAKALERRFRIIKKLGAGGMGAVYLAEQVTLGNRPVALKVLSRSILDDPDFLRRFQNEGASTASIRHPNVVTIYESGQADDGTPYIAMEYLEGESLGQALRGRGALPLAECAEILQQTGRGLNAAHKLGIIHRDLKPDNIFLTRGDEGALIVKVVDFGIAKLRESTSHTLTGTVLGTPRYMSSEQASGMRGDQLDARSDIYSLGIVAYEMLTGSAPFQSDTPLGYLSKHLLEPPPPLQTMAPGLSLPAELEAVVMKALVKNRDLRYSSVLEFVREFACAAGAPSQAVSLAPGAQGVTTTSQGTPADFREGASTLPMTVRVENSPQVAVQTPPSIPAAAAKAASRELEPAKSGLPPGIGDLETGELPAPARAGRAPAPSPPPPPSNRAAQTHRTSRVAMTGSAAVVILAVVLIWWKWPGAPTPKNPDVSAPAVSSPASNPNPPKENTPQVSAPVVSSPATNTPPPKQHTPEVSASAVRSPVSNPSPPRERKTEVATPQVTTPQSPAPGKSRGPFSETDVLTLLKGGVMPRRVDDLAHEYGINFPITSEVEADLREAGADDDLLNTLRELAPRP